MQRDAEKPPPLRALIIERNSRLAEAAETAARLVGSISVECIEGVLPAAAVLTRYQATLIVAHLDFSDDACVNFVRFIRTPGITPVPNVVLLAMTTPLDQDEITRSIRLGVDHILVPPIPAVDLAERIRIVLQRRAEPIVTTTYIGPCRRRLPDATYSGPNRRILSSLRELAKA
ncbi:MAG: hypothetical protein WD673_17185 [Alphaproteobacteria bacterium]